MIANPHRGEILAKIDDKEWLLCLTLGALASLEDALDVEHLGALSQKFSSGSLKARELTLIIWAGLSGGGHDVSLQEVEAMRIEGGAAGFVDVAAKLLNATFAPRDE